MLHFFHGVHSLRVAGSIAADRRQLPGVGERVLPLQQHARGSVVLRDMDHLKW